MHAKLTYTVEAPLTRLIGIPLLLDSNDCFVVRVDAPESWLASRLGIPVAHLRFDRVFGIVGGPFSKAPISHIFRTLAIS